MSESLYPTSWRASSGWQMASETRPILTILPLLAGADLRWIRDRESPGRGYLLQAGGELVGRLHFSDPLDSTATGESAVGSWIFMEEGLLRPRVSVRSLPGKRHVAVYRCGLLGLSGHLEFGDGRRFCWRKRGLHRSDCCFENAQGMPLVAVEAECCRSWLFGSRFMAGLVRIEPGACALSELMLLLLLSWYLLVLPESRAGYGGSP